MGVELTPEQPPEVDEAVARLLEQASVPAAQPTAPDPWWRAGLAEALDP